MNKVLKPKNLLENALYVVMVIVSNEAGGPSASLCVCLYPLCNYQCNTIRQLITSVKGN